MPIEVTLSIIDGEGKVRGHIEKLLGITDKFILMEDDDGDEVINISRFLKIEPEVPLPQILAADSVIIINGQGKPIFQGPPWNGDRVAEFLLRVWKM